MKTLLFALAALGLATPALAVDHAPFDALLKANVKGESVDYKGFVGNADFEKYVATLVATDPDTLGSDKEKLAFWINAYNAFTISGVLKHWPAITSVSSAYPDFGFFKRPDYTVNGKALALNDIENNIVRPTFKDPRIHAALNCASVSCPPLMPFAFKAESLDAQLDKAMTGFIRDRARNKIDPKTGTVALSEIFNWYGADFTAAGGVKAYIKTMLTDEAEKAALDKAKIAFQPYDWGLNAVR